MYVDDGVRSWWVQPLSDVLENADPNAYVIYSHEDVLPGTSVCGTTWLPHPLAPAVMAAAPEGAITCHHKAEIAFDTDVEYYTLVGSSAANVASDIGSVMSIVDFIYRRDCGITYEITDIIVRTAPFAQYSSSDGGALLTAFENEWNANQGAIPRDVAHMMSGKDLMVGANDILGIANYDGICTSIAYGLSEYNLSLSAAERVTITAHELGHNWNAQHCNVVDSPLPSQACPLPVPDCSIMCNSVAGCPNSISLSFEPCSAQTIMNYRDTRPCLGPAGSVGLGTEKIVANDSQPGDNFGQSVSMSGDLMVIGAPQTDSPVIDAGAAYIFRRDKVTGDWSQENTTAQKPLSITDLDWHGAAAGSGILLCVFYWYWHSSAHSKPGRVDRAPNRFG
jgi:hypothetical protein